MALPDTTGSGCSTAEVDSTGRREQKLAERRGKRLQRIKTVSMDYSVAKGGSLCAYRWDGETELLDEKFVWVDAHKRE